MKTAAASTAQFLDFETVARCPACGAEEIWTAVQPDIGQCRRCRVYFRNPRPTQSEIARSYDTGGTFSAWQEQEAARAAMWERRLALVQRFVPDGKLLDVGTGDGRFLAAAKEAGYEVVGSEVSEAGAIFARHRGFDVHLGQIVDLDLPAESFDLATIWHVLEHVPDPQAVLRKVCTLLKPGGVVAVAVPNEENFFFRRRFGRARTAPFDPLTFGGEIHLTYFQPSSLRSTLQSAGFELWEFGVDDAYHTRNWKVHLRLCLQQFLARTFDWHFAVAMYVLGRRPAR